MKGKVGMSYVGWKAVPQRLKCRRLCSEQSLSSFFYLAGHSVPPPVHILTDPCRSELVGRPVKLRYYTGTLVKQIALISAVVK